MTHQNDEGNLLHLYPDYFTGKYKGVNAHAFAMARTNADKLKEHPKMITAIKSVLDSLSGKIVNEGYITGEGQEIHYIHRSKWIIILKTSNNLPTNI